MPILQSLSQVFGSNINLSFEQLVELLSAQPVSIPIQPLTEQVAGKSLTIALASNAITIQLH